MKMNNWNTLQIKKEVLGGQTVKNEFEYISDKKITNIEPRCGCTKYTFKDNILTAFIDVDKVSYVLPKSIYKTQKTYSKSVNIDVYYDDNTTDRLNIDLTVKDAF